MATAFPDRLDIPEALWQAMLAHLSACLPEEGCGLLGGPIPVDGAAIAVYILTVENELHSPVRFRMPPAALLAALNTLESRGLDLLAVFHSHPNGPEQPSPTDCAEFAYPGVLSLIATPEPVEHWRIRAFAIDGVLDPHAPVREVALRRILEPAHPHD